MKSKLPNDSYSF